MNGTAAVSLGRRGAAALVACCVAACHPAQEPAAMTRISKSDGAAAASRLPPPIVAPVVIDGITYRQVMGSSDPAVGQFGGWLGAFAADGAPLWTMKVYDNRRDPDLEGDVQDVYFQSMQREADGHLRIENEAGDQFQVDVHSRTSVALPRAPDDGLVPDGGLYPD
jgi:hypothetical protein